ncbi:MAG: pilus assembly PilX N-terminal domain-containing protein [Alkalibacterium sp.]|nr:pilus assembly PilX N-terminal domain-containing protein [Alkalibacterium sp.]
MSFIKKCLYIKNEEGSGLVLALMTLLVLSVLGASLGAVTVGSFKLGDVNRDDTSAYYIAEAGANMAYEEMEEVLWMSNLIKKHSI